MSPLSRRVLVLMLRVVLVTLEVVALVVAGIAIISSEKAVAWVALAIGMACMLGDALIARRSR